MIIIICKFWFYLIYKQYNIEQSIKWKNVKLTIQMSMPFTHCNDYALPRNINFNISWYFL